MGLFSGIGKAIKGVVGSISGGDLLGSAIGYFGQERANDMNMDIASMNNETAINLANTRYQRQVKDLVAAGLNPMLGYLKHDGGNVPNLQQAKVENSAASAAQNMLMTAQVRQANAQAMQAESQAELNSATALKTKTETGLEQIKLDSETAAKMQRMDADYLEHVARGSRASLERFSNSLDYNTLQELQAMAKHYGHSTYEAALKDVDYRKAVLDLFHQKLRTNEMKAYSDMYGTDYGKNVAPYVNSAKDLGVTGAAIGAGAASLLRKPNIINKSSNVIPLKDNKTRYMKGK